ncbi:MAG TPA: hypothetical protein VGI54_02325 [Solirubrobacteraceae bacterium]
MTLQVKGDAEAIERYARDNGELFRSISGAGREAGAAHHAFYASDDGTVMVVDEWDSPESFTSFFEEQGERIGGIMQAAGVTDEPRITFWHKVETGDDF